MIRIYGHNIWCFSLSLSIRISVLVFRPRNNNKDIKNKNRPSCYKYIDALALKRNKTENYNGWFNVCIMFMKTKWPNAIEGTMLHVFRWLRRWWCVWRADEKTEWKKNVHNNLETGVCVDVDTGPALQGRRAWTETAPEGRDAIIIG